MDKDEANIIHSCGEDGSVVSFNLKTIKRMICHMVTSGSVYNMTQRFDARSEKELITCDSLVGGCSFHVYKAVNVNDC